VGCRKGAPPRLAVFIELHDARTVTTQSQIVIRRPWTARATASLRPVLWIGPAVALIAVVVLWPVVVLIHSSFQNIAADGFVVGSAGTRNYSNLWHEPALKGVVFRTVIWVVAVVGVTLLLSLALAQLFNQRLMFRRVARTALIAPWAASVLMTALIFRWALDPNVGSINIVLHALGIVHRMGSNQADWLGRPGWALVWMMIVAIFVSLPFTTYALLSGLQTISSELYEAARVDGAGRWHTYRTITLPLLRPAILVATTINVINVFNSFPIIWEMTRGGPGYETSTTTTFMFILKQSFIGEAAAMSVANFLLVIVVVLIFLRVTRWKEQVS
jgi:multiple sugar transport system permease protein